MKKHTCLGSRRGSTLVEFALCAPVLMLVLLGTFQFGYGFYAYNQLQLAVRSGVRYASLMDYKAKTNSCISTVKDYSKNVVVYGAPVPANGAQPLIRGLSPSNVIVDFNPDASGVPTMVTMTISNFNIDVGVATIRVNNKPWAAVPFSGRYAPAECY